MANTNSYRGSSSLSFQASASFSGDTQGSRTGAWAFTRTYSPAGGDSPTISGFVRGTITVAAGDLLLAHASDPFQGMGDATYSDGFTVAGTKIKAIAFRNCSDSLSITIARGAANGLPIFDAAGDAITLPPLGCFVLEFPSGTAALTTGSNDKLTLAPSSGSPTMEILVIYGP